MKKPHRIIYWVATLWLAFGMLSTGIMQLMKAKAGQGGADMIAHLGYPIYLLTMLGIAKIAGTIVLLIPGIPVLKEWAYAGFFFIMTGALASHIALHDALSELLPSLLLLVLTLTSCYFRPLNRKIVLQHQ